MQLSFVGGPGLVELLRAESLNGDLPGREYGNTLHKYCIGIRLSLLTTSKLKEIDVIGWASSLHASWALRIQGIFMMKLSTAIKMRFLEIWHFLGSF